MSFRLVCDHPPFMMLVTRPEIKRLPVMQLSTLLPKAMKPALFSLPTACCAVGLALTAHAETRIGIDLGLRIGVPAPIIVREAPPRPIVERMSLSPGSGYI